MGKNQLGLTCLPLDKTVNSNVFLEPTTVFTVGLALP
jgi:hypothetical protein